MADTVYIQIRHKETVAGVEWNDAQYLTQAEYAAPGAQLKIDAEKAKRVAAFASLIQNPPKQVDPTKDELVAQKLQLVAQVAELDVKIAGAK